MSTHPSELRGLQRWMLDTLLTPQQQSRQAVEQTFLPGSHLDAAACLAIYQRSYRLRLRHCLTEQFPATCYALGENLFCEFVDEYLRDCPSESYTLYDLGQRFSTWLNASRPDAANAPHEKESWIDFLVELTSYEWTLFRLFDAPGHEEQPWPHAASDERNLKLQPCLVLAEYRYPVAAYYHAVRDQKSPQFPPPTKSHLVILRSNYRTATFPVSAFHFQFLRKVQELGNAAAALDAIAETSHLPLDDLYQSWRNEVKAPWIEAGFFVATEPAPTREATAQS